MRVALVFAAGLIVGGTASFSPAADADKLFESGSRVLERRCVFCHQGEDAKGGLDLSTRAGALKGGESGPAIAPRDPNASLILDYVTGDKPEMPKNGEPLTNDEVAALRAWIAAGAEWPADKTLVDRRFEGSTWWSLAPLARPEPPRVKSDWAKTPIDAFVLAKLAEHQLSPAPEADRRTLIRRLTFDLHGLPPTPEEVAAFLADASPDAYEKLVDRLLASPRYGERWGRHWLDVVHYGDTHGYDKDKIRANAWRYRDYVVKSFNDDKPYTRFVQEQLAGDVLWPQSEEALIATGFVAAGPWDFVGHVELAEGSTDKQITRSLDRDDMVASTIMTFCSLTAQCARCHDHKFDPIPQEDYYRLQAVFAGVERGDRPLDDPRQVEFRRRLVESRDATRKALEAVDAKIAKLTSPELAAVDAEVAKLQDEAKSLGSPFASAEPSPTNGYHSAIMPTAEAVKWVQVDLGESRPLDAIRVLPARPTDFADTPGFGFPPRYTLAISDDPTFAQGHVLHDSAGQDEPNPGDRWLAYPTNGKRARYVRFTAQKLWTRTGDYVFALAELQVESEGKNVAADATVSSLDAIDAGRWNRKHLVDGYSSRAKLPPFEDPGVREAVAKLDAVQRRLDEVVARQTELRAALVPAEWRAARAAIEQTLAAEEKTLKATPASNRAVYAPIPRPPRPIHVLARGSVTTPKHEVAPGALRAAPGPSADFSATASGPEGARRAALAKWITDEANPLTWRSIANRIWQYHFGQGLAASPNDFGRMGVAPTHPELLDWLAVEFRDGGQSFKTLHKLILTSAVYKQSCAARDDYAKIDAGNRFLWRQNRKRLEAESLHDAILAVSGKLDATMGGPGYFAFAFKDDHSPHYEYDKHAPDDPKSFRRSVYRFIVRSVPDPFMECLDAADASQNVAVRNETLTPLQALAMFNNSFVLKQSEYFAQRVSDATPRVSEQVTLAFRLAFGRSPSEDEAKTLVEFAEKRGLANACRVLFNSNEFVFVD